MEKFSLTLFTIWQQRARYGATKYSVQRTCYLHLSHQRVQTSIGETPHPIEKKNIYIYPHPTHSLMVTMYLNARTMHQSASARI